VSNQPAEEAVREDHVKRIDAAHHALSAAQDGGGRQAIAQADEVLNAVVRNSSLAEMRAWAAMANRRAGL
jgi:hypothetical protein